MSVFVRLGPTIVVTLSNPLTPLSQVSTVADQRICRVDTPRVHSGRCARERETNRFWRNDGRPIGRRDGVPFTSGRERRRR